jgi:SAM-dependent methyltransferase
MEPEIYLKTAALEEVHWWFRGRRAILESVLKTLPLPRPARLLEIGCGTGGNFPILAPYGELCAVELDEVARGFAAARNLATVAAGSLPRDIPFEDTSFDLVALIDVLEHVAEDELSLRKVHELLKPGGFALVTVPAFPFLWSRHDELHHHRRRYVRPELLSLARQAGFQVSLLSYIDTFLFPAIALWRLVGAWGKLKEKDDLALPAPWVNACLARVFGFESRLLALTALPFGVSLLLVARRAP